jgi:hypothetical protein
LDFADKGFIKQRAFEALLEKGLKLITSIRSTMKNKLLVLKEKLLLKKRGMVEVVIDLLKSVWHRIYPPPFSCQYARQHLCCPGTKTFCLSLITPELTLSYQHFLKPP